MIRSRLRWRQAIAWDRPIEDRALKHVALGRCTVVAVVRVLPKENVDGGEREGQWSMQETIEGD